MQFHMYKNLIAFAYTKQFASQTISKKCKLAAI